MHFENHFKIGDKIEIELEQQFGDPRVLKSQLLEVSDCKSMYYISLPTEKGRLIPISEGKKITLYYSVHSKGTFSFQAVVEERKKNPIPHMKVRQIDKTIKTQRRNYYRLHVLLPVEVYDMERNPVANGNTLDISGGGIRLFISKRLEEREEYYFAITLDGKRFLSKGMVLRRSIPNYELPDEYEAAIKFTMITEEDRNMIIKYIFKQQRILRQKGLI